MLWSLIYPTTIADHMPSRLRHACGRSAVWPTSVSVDSEPTDVLSSEHSDCKSRAVNCTKPFSSDIHTEIVVTK